MKENNRTNTGGGKKRAAERDLFSHTQPVEESDLPPSCSSPGRSLSLTHSLTPRHMVVCYPTAAEKGKSPHSLQVWDPRFSRTNAEPCLKAETHVASYTSRQNDSIRPLNGRHEFPRFGNIHSRSFPTGPPRGGGRVHAYAVLYTRAMHAYEGLPGEEAEQGIIAYIKHLLLYRPLALCLSSPSRSNPVSGCVSIRKKILCTDLFLPPVSVGGDEITSSAANSC
ncbi:hypothetical protein ASPZODRAFT_127637 [Penicilliopsis zonata CBS 506.65]|uniref:Uncharacterized protein n=1 Tax=Penicilliopsis zonata CBS 506.65 TaxID=1073090 RepID=A0A1L9SWW5_9EURO|nr:hypothetical protein ASPZODRAFT_127637 [Penicilliopsis zonata CBS 506.65]OJJ51543.1 hypothetical protein ASPZODRAFT_127637 [Penicilliopsis zonata CBS 506.65]